MKDFVSYEKMSKKKKKEQDRKKRKFWDMDPSTKVQKMNYKKKRNQEKLDSLLY